MDRSVRFRLIPMLITPLAHRKSGTLGCQGITSTYHFSGSR